MPQPPSVSIIVLFPQEGESWPALAKRMEETSGELLLVLSGKEEELLASPAILSTFLAECKKLQQRLRIATKHPVLAGKLRSDGFRVLDRTKHVRALLKNNPRLGDALRLFSPHLWRQLLKSRLQRMGLLSVPKLRIFSLVSLSILLFYFVIFHLLPSADIRIRPRQESINQTVNILLVQSGAVLDPSSPVRTMPLVSITVHASRSMIFTHISKESIGTASTLPLTIVNNTADVYSLRKGTRFTNQAGMVFRIRDAVIIEPGKPFTVRAKADDKDQFGEIIGERGNVPAGLRWDIPGLQDLERQKIYAENKKAGTGGTTSIRTVLSAKDLELAEKSLQQELLVAAKHISERELQLRNAQGPSRRLRLIDDERLVSIVYDDENIPKDQIGQALASVPVSGSISYTVYAYDAQAILAMLRQELEAHVRDGRRLLGDHLGLESLVVTPIAHADNFSTIKLTVDLTGTEQYILDPLTPTGALFARKVRTLVTGMDKAQAVRIMRNLPEVEAVSIAQWPPWRRTLPSIASHISIVTQ